MADTTNRLGDMHRAAHSCRYCANAVFLLYYVLVQLNWLTSRAQRRDLQKENPVKTWKKYSDLSKPSGVCRCGKNTTCQWESVYHFNITHDCERSFWRYIWRMSAWMYHGLCWQSCKTFIQTSVAAFRIALFVPESYELLRWQHAWQQTVISA